MRFISLALLSVLVMLSLPAQAAVVWSETTERGVPVTRWAMGANINEAYAATKVASGQPYSVVATCRAPGYFAYVGSMGQTQRGVSCGYETAEAALFEARARCEREGGRCDLEKLGHDTGKPIADNAAAGDLPKLLSGIISDSNADSVTMPR